MKNWLLKFRISAALDSGKPIPPDLQAKIEASTKLKAFFKSTLSLEDQLRNGLPKDVAPAFLQEDIITTVRARVSRQPSRGRSKPWRWLPISTAACLIVLLAWSWTQRALDSKIAAPALSSPSRAIEIGGRVAQTAPATLISPLSEELERLNEDVEKTVRFLAASVP